jgi:hypothetical protein
MREFTATEKSSLREAIDAECARYRLANGNLTAAERNQIAARLIAQVTEELREPDSASRKF